MAGAKQPKLGHPPCYIHPTCPAFRNTWAVVALAELRLPTGASARNHAACSPERLRASETAPDCVSRGQGKRAVDASARPDMGTSPSRLTPRAGLTRLGVAPCGALLYRIRAAKQKDNRRSPKEGQRRSCHMGFAAATCFKANCPQTGGPPKVMHPPEGIHGALAPIPAGGFDRPVKTACDAARGFRFREGPARAGIADAPGAEASGGGGARARPDGAASRERTGGSEVTPGRGRSERWAVDARRLR
jgi:hypothetical protein